MQLTIFGAIVAALGLVMLLFKRPLRDFLAALLISAVLGGAEAVALPALGGASLTVPYFFVLFVILRLFLLAYGNAPLFIEAVRANIWIILYAAYGLVAAMTLPRAFEGAMSVFPMRALPYRTLLTFTSQNITQSTYICLSALTSIAAYAAARTTKSEEALSKGWIIATVACLVFALADLIGFYAGLGDVMNWARTASYAMVSQVHDGVRRISGSFPEPSTFAGFGAGPLFYFGLLWLLNIRGNVAGPLFIGLAIALAMSTSSTAYGLLAVTLLTVIGGLFLMPMKPRVRRRKFMQFSAAIFAALGALGAALVLMPEMGNAFLKVVESMTLKKGESSSAIERGLWAAQGFEAFKVSRGLGIGPGSFRSSGVVQAIIGSMGVLGCLFMAMHLLRIAKVVIYRGYDPEDRITWVFGAAGILMLTPQIAANSSPDVGILFAVMSGFALGKYRNVRLRARLQALEMKQFTTVTTSSGGVQPLDAR